eukprot:gene17463-biopygen4257
MSSGIHQPRAAAARGADLSADAAGALAGLPRTAAACCGKALCGDFGSDTQQQFMSIGGISSLLLVVERLAARWDVAALVDAGVHADADIPDSNDGGWVGGYPWVAGGIREASHEWQSKQVLKETLKGI